jgi:hypothetical protein
MSFDLHVVTPCARPVNLPRIAESIRAAALPNGVSLHWLVLLDDRFDIPPVALADAEVVSCHGATGVAGHAARNEALERITGGWIVFVDDDNLLHPDLPRLLASAVAAHPDARFIVFDQDLGDEIRRAAPENVRIGAIDSGQFAFDRSFAGNLRFDVYAYSADGIFASDLFARAPERFAFVSETAAHYNALNAGRFGEPPPGRKTNGPLPPVHNAGSLHFHRTFATEDLVRHVMDGKRHRLRLSDGAVLRAPIGGGRRRLRGRAWILSGSRGGTRLQIAVNGRAVIDRHLRFRVPLRLLGGRKFDLTFDAPPAAEIEIRVTGSGTVVLEIQNV